MVIIRKWENGREYFLCPSKSRSQRFYEIWFSESMKNPGWKCHCEFVSLYPDKVCRHIKMVDYYLRFNPQMIVNDEQGCFVSQ